MCRIEPYRKPFEIDDADTRSTTKKYRRHAQECTSCTFLGCVFSFTPKHVSDLHHRHPWQVQKLTSLSIFEREFLLSKNVATAWNHRRPWRIYDTLRIFRSGTDAAGLNRSDISALPKFAIKSVHGCTLLMMRRSRCTVYPRKKPFENRRHRC